MVDKIEINLNSTDEFIDMDESKPAHQQRIKMIYHGKHYEGEPIKDDANLSNL